MAASKIAKVPPIFELNADGFIDHHFHEGQLEAWYSAARTLAIIAGLQSGKTCFGPPWMFREMQERGPGDYLVVAPTYPLMNKKVLPEFKRYFSRYLQLGRYLSSEHVYKFTPEGTERTFGRAYSDETQVFFGHADDPDSLESATAKAAWLDESGQKKFKADSYESIQGRLSIHEGRDLHTTTPYNLGWLKKRVWDRYKAGDKSVYCVSFKSIMNPAFPRDEYYRMKKILPPWKFGMRYDGLFTKPAGLIYDNFDEAVDTCPRFTLDPTWPRYMGLDFGGVNTAAVFFAEELITEGNQRNPTGRFFLYREYHEGGRTAKAHAEALRRGEPMMPDCVGGSKSEGQWRDEFAAGGLAVRAPDISDVAVGIDRIYGAHAEHKIIVFDDLVGYLGQKGSYARALNENNEPTEEIEDKEEFHFMDAERYIGSRMFGARGSGVW